MVSQSISGYLHDVPDNNISLLIELYENFDTNKIGHFQITFDLILKQVLVLILSLD